MRIAQFRTWTSTMAVAAIVGGLLATTTADGLADEYATGEISFYECGDNCYLTIVTDAGEELTGMCAAAECDAWNEVAEMPAHLVGRSVTVTIEMGQQLDAEGNVMGEFPAFTDLVFEN